MRPLWAAGTIAPFDLVFLDPPYRLELGEKALASAAAGGWLNEGALCIWEEDASVSPVIPDGFEGLDARHTGDSQILVLRYIGV